MNILALDTASYKTGYAIYKNGLIVEHGVIAINGSGNTEAEKMENRLRQLYTKVGTLISKHKITQLVAEDYYEDKDPNKKRGAIALAKCRGVLIAISQQYQLPQNKYIEPIKVKQIIWRYDKSRKDHREMKSSEHKERMIKAVEGLGYQLKTDRNGNKSQDQADAIGILVTYLKLHQMQIVHPKDN